MTVSEALWKDQARHSGAVCFRNTRVPVSLLFEYLESGDLEEFYRGYPDVSREQVRVLLAATRRGEFRPGEGALDP